MGESRGRVFRNNYKGHLDKARGGRTKGGRWGGMGQGGIVGEKWG